MRRSTNNDLIADLQELTPLELRVLHYVYRAQIFYARLVHQLRRHKLAALSIAFCVPAGFALAVVASPH